MKKHLPQLWQVLFLQPIFDYILQMNGGNALLAQQSQQFQNALAIGGNVGNSDRFPLRRMDRDTIVGKGGAILLHHVAQQVILKGVSGSALVDASVFVCLEIHHIVLPLS